MAPGRLMAAQANAESGGLRHEHIGRKRYCPCDTAAGLKRYSAAHLLHERFDQTHPASRRFHLNESNAVIADGQTLLGLRDAMRHANFSTGLRERMQIRVVDQSVIMMPNAVATSTSTR
jgi:hypothetical protein